MQPMQIHINLDVSLKKAYVFDTAITISHHRKHACMYVVMPKIYAVLHVCCFLIYACQTIYVIIIITQIYFKEDG